VFEGGGQQKDVLKAVGSVVDVMAIFDVNVRGEGGAAGVEELPVFLLGESVEKEESEVKKAE
jgi:hypothetical protein